MKITKAKYIYLEGKFYTGFGFLFDEKILEVNEAKTLEEKYPEAEVIDKGEAIIMPGLINVHQHLEFSANKNTLSYGAFMPWLHSVIENRDTLMQACDEALIEQKLAIQLKSGTTTIGEISSSGVDLKACSQAKQRVVFFNELIGSSPNMVDALYADFNSRLSASQSYTSPKFYPALAIHSPYSVHPVLLKKALQQAKEQGLKVSTHFLESEDEKQWLSQNSGGFLGFFQKFFNASSAVNSADEFLNAFAMPALFTHCNYADQKQQELLKQHFVTHCPVSNRLLGNKKLDIKQFDNLCLATDGLSSNISLSLFDEMRFALMIHDQYDLHTLADKLLKAVTSNPAKALDLPIGKIQKGCFADFIVLDLLEVKDEKQLPLQIILHTKEVKETFIAGKKV